MKNPEHNSGFMMRWHGPVLLFLLGLGSGWLGYRILSAPATDINAAAHSVREADPNYKLINPLVECELAQDSFKELRPFKDKVENFVNLMNAQDNRLDFLALYFRDLNNGLWLGVNENADFAPASLLKVPIMITYFKEAEADPTILEKQYKFEDDGQLPSAEQTILPAKVLELGKSYTVDDLLYRMIVYSDNLAQHLLVKNIDVLKLNGVFDDFGLPVPNKDQLQTAISVQTYASFFRVLFNASYLTREHSEKALELLTQSQFVDGLVAGVPSGTAVAHKFGERQAQGQPEKQLHDCGIVYYPNHPYLLCIMSRGSDIPSLAKNIRDVSRYVYSEVDSQFHQ